MYLPLTNVRLSFGPFGSNLRDCFSSIVKLKNWHTPLLLRRWANLITWYMLQGITSLPLCIPHLLPCSLRPRTNPPPPSRARVHTNTELRDWVGILVGQSSVTHSNCLHVLNFWVVAINELWIFLFFKLYNFSFLKFSDPVSAWVVENWPKEGSEIQFIWGK